MKNNEIHEANQSDFLKNVSDVLLQAQKNAKTAVNLSMVYAYYEIGRMIVEEEQHGENRATYGKKLLKELSTYLTGMFGKGYSAENLKLMRRFYSIYSHDQIGETVFTQFENLPAISTGRKFYLSWSHYLKLMRIDNIDERHFYEIECVKNDWSLSELKRQYNSALYERLALSTDKSFQVTQEHFAEEYGKKIRFFIYNSAQLTEIDRFASDSAINVMIINSQAFNARGKDARRIYMELDDFNYLVELTVICFDIVCYFLCKNIMLFTERDKPFINLV